MTATLVEFLAFWVSVFTGSGLAIVVIVACVLSIFRVKLPKKNPNDPSWFPDERNY